MKRLLFIIIFMVIISFTLSGCQLTATVSSVNTSQSTGMVAAIRCAQPAPEHLPICQQWEQEMLATTVRIQLSGWLASAEENTATWTRLDTEVGHGTVKDGRYLVTHNHYHLPFDLIRAGRVTGLVSLFTSTGEPILSKADINIVSVAYADSQTLVLDFHTESGEGLFELLDTPSATFKTWTNLPLQPGLEVAQIDWDGTRAHIEWVEIEAIVTNSETPKLELANFNEIGSSGGGVYWQGVHIANNWQRTTTHDSGRQFSSVALNSRAVVTIGNAVAQVASSTAP